MSARSPRVITGTDSFRRVDQENKEGYIPYSQTSAGVQEMNRIRTKVVQELINTEQDFVKHLRDIVEVGEPILFHLIQ